MVGGDSGGFGFAPISSSLGGVSAGGSLKSAPVQGGGLGFMYSMLGGDPGVRKGANVRANGGRGPSRFPPARDMTGWGGGTGPSISPFDGLRTGSGRRRQAQGERGWMARRPVGAKDFSPLHDHEAWTLDPPVTAGLDPIDPSPQHLRGSTVAAQVPISAYPPGSHR